MRRRRRWCGRWRGRRRRKVAAGVLIWHFGLHNGENLVKKSWSNFHISRSWKLENLVKSLRYYMKTLLFDKFFELIENRTFWWEIGLFWRNFYHRGLLTGHIRHTAVGHHGLHGRLSTDRVSIALAWSHALFIFFDENPVSVSPVNKQKNVFIFNTG